MRTRARSPTSSSLEPFNVVPFWLCCGSLLGYSLGPNKTTVESLGRDQPEGSRDHEGPSEPNNAKARNNGPLPHHLWKVVHDSGPLAFELVGTSKIRDLGLFGYTTLTISHEDHGEGTCTQVGTSEQRQASL